jgi:hypothetical protein
LLSNTAAAQKDSTPTPALEQKTTYAWIVPLGIAVSVAADPEMREWVLEHHSPAFNRIARSVNPLGTASRLVPAMAVTYAAALLTHRESLAEATLNTAGAYIASDLVESALKPMVGRERPHVEGNSHRFRAFSGSGDWHSFPSAHVAHITSIATAISLQTRSRPVTAVCNGLVTLVAWDRVYEDQHWTSDVIATEVLTSAISRAAVNWLDSHWTHRHHGDRATP